MNELAEMANDHRWPSCTGVDTACCRHKETGEYIYKAVPSFVIVLSVSFVILSLYWYCKIKKPAIKHGKFFLYLHFFFVLLGLFSSMDQHSMGHIAPEIWQKCVNHIEGVTVVCNLYECELLVHFSHLIQISFLPCDQEWDKTNRYSSCPILSPQKAYKENLEETIANF